MASTERTSNYEVLHQLLANDGFFVERTNHENAEESSDEGLEREESLQELSQTETFFAGEVSADDVEESQRDENIERGEKAERNRKLLFNKKETLTGPKKGGKSFEAGGKVAIKAPSISWGNTLSDNTEEDTNIIAVLGRVLAICAMTGIEFQKNIWEQATNNMMQAVGLAPAIADAVEKTAEEQANATRAEASMSKSDGITNITFAGFSMFLGIKETFFGDKPKVPDTVGSQAIDNSDNAADQAARDGEQQAENAAESRVAGGGAGPGGAAANAAPRVAPVDPASSVPANRVEQSAQDIARAEAAAPANNIRIEPAPGAGGGANPADGPAPAGGDGRAPGPGGNRNINVQGQAPNNVPQETKGWWDRFKNNVMSFGGKTYQAFLKSFQVATGMQMMSQGICGVANDAPGKTEQAAHQQAAGAQDANSKMGEMIAQFENQAYQRAEDIRQSGRQSGIDNPCNVWKTAADTITQAVLAQHA